jgi:GNAT superfamily N-acetyltransferase
MEIIIRDAVPGDERIILEYIRKLATFENLLEAVHATEEGLARDLFDLKLINASVALVHTELASETAGFIVWYYVYSTFQGKPSIYIEDLYVDDRWRGNGIAREFFRHLENKGLKEKCASIKWSVLSWNENAKRFYRSIGGKTKTEWELFELEINSKTQK